MRLKDKGLSGPASGMVLAKLYERSRFAAVVAVGLPSLPSLYSAREIVMKKHRVVIGLFVGLLASVGVRADNGMQFPYRDKYKQIPVMEVAQLRQDFDKVIVVDVRSNFEYDTLHVKGALHIKLDKTKLPAAVKELRAKSAHPIVFYCNGTTCQKSYEAAELAIRAGVDNVFAYDAGIDAWSRQYPELSVLLGKSPVHASDLISRDEFRKHVINTQDFEARVERGAVLLDIRDLRQRDIALYPMRELRAPLDDSQKIADAVAEAKRLNKTLLVYDKVGKQTRWFQYYLEKQGIKDYYFLDGGSEGYFEARYGKPKFAVPEHS
jgi:rhodanese-related sulfurtransferase